MLNLLVTDALAQSPVAPIPGQMSGSMSSFVMLGAMFVLFYFILIRPQIKKQKQHRALIDGLVKGDEVVTNGGVLGRITDVNEHFLTLEIANETQVKIQKHAIQLLLPKGTIKSLAK